MTAKKKKTLKKVDPPAVVETPKSSQGLLTPGTRIPEGTNIFAYQTEKLHPNRNLPAYKPPSKRSPEQPVSNLVPPAPPKKKK